MLTFIAWWYGPGFLWAFGRIPASLQRIGQVFAVSVLLKTWFAPWKQISETATFRTFFQVAINNFISRLIGSFVRGLMLFLAFVWGLLAIAGGLIFVIIWPFLPLSIVILPILAAKGQGL